MNWKIERLSNVCTRMTIPYKANPEWEQWGLLTADRHLDHPKSDRKLQRLHLDQAKEKQAFVIDIGDLFDAMQGRNDRRGTKSDLMNRHKESNYLNQLVEDAYEFLEPYKENLAVIGEGNHETAITKHMEYSLIDGLTYLLKKDGSPVVRGGYRGYLRFQFHHESGGARQSKTAYWHHGSGGGGPVTKGVIQTSRRAVYLPDADMVFTGHIHEQWKVPITRSRITASGNEYIDTQYHVQLPTYKDEFTNIDGGFHHEGGRPPKPIGAWWIRFYYSARTGKIETQILEAES